MNWVERIRRESIEAIGLRVNTTLPVEVRSAEPYALPRDSLHRVDGPFSVPEIQRMAGTGSRFSGNPADIYYLFSSWPGAMTPHGGMFIPMSHIVGDGFMANVHRVEDDLFGLAREGNVAEVKAVLDAGADVTQRGQGGRPVLIIARESLAGTNPARKVFTDEISTMIIDAKERATRNRRAHALAAVGSRGSRRARRSTRRRASRRTRN
jgi:hypothetical protein